MRAAVHTVALAPILETADWVGVAGLSVRLEQGEAERLAALTGAEVMILGTDAVIATTGDACSAAMAGAVDRAPPESGCPRSSSPTHGLWWSCPPRANADGDFDAPVRPSRVTEVSHLAAAFASMREALRARLREIEDRQVRLTTLQADVCRSAIAPIRGAQLDAALSSMRQPMGSPRGVTNSEIGVRPFHGVRANSSSTSRSSDFASLSTVRCVPVGACSPP